MDHIQTTNAVSTADKVPPVPTNAALMTHSTPMHGKTTIRRRLIATGVLAVGLLSASAALSSTSHGDVWAQASARSGIPVRVLHGIALVESGRRWSDGAVRPWPWTLNSPETGPKYFADRASAEAALRRLLARGVTNVDIGIMQINCGYHCNRVADPAQLLDADTNIQVAGDILLEYRQRKGGNIAATVGAYHAGLHPDREARSRWYQDAVAARVRRISGRGAA